MNTIIKFYKELDTLNLIIFWGIIIIIILLIIFSILIINKNKKNKKIDRQFLNEEEIPIKEKEEQIIKQEENNLNTKKDLEIVIPSKELQQEETEHKKIELAKDFVAEEHVSEYKNDKIINTNSEHTEKISQKTEINQVKTIEIPKKPYQKNVLREMSLSQTSPIGINRQEQRQNKKIELVKDLELSLNNEIEKEINNINNVKIQTEQKKAENIIVKNNLPEKKDTIEVSNNKYNNNEIPYYIKELLSDETTKRNKTEEKKDSEKYLEEVSRKLSEAEDLDEIERTDYELKQEEDAVISYKELMEKKDSIQTIDEEDAIISIEELMNKTKENHEKESENVKLYNISESEENDDFIKELKQFRNDL